MKKREFGLKDILQVRRLFKKVKKTYPNEFGDLKLRIRLFGETALYIFHLEPEYSFIDISIMETIWAKKNAPLFYKRDKELGRSIDKSYGYLQFSLLHELGHWLDFWIDEEAYEIKLADQELLIKNLYDLEDIVGITNDERNSKYKGFPLEKTADIFAIFIGRFML